MMMEQARQYLKKYFGYDQFRSGQDAIIEQVLNGRNTAGVMPTGGGKSICYQIPALMLPGVTLVISPLISLMKDQVDTLLQNGIEATLLNSSISASEADQRLRDIKEGVYKLVYVAPERLENPYFMRELQELDISLVAIDEAHCISQWGHDFRPSYLRINPLIEQIPSRPVVLALTATATPIVQKDICRSLGIDEDDAISTGFARKNLIFSTLKDENRDQYLSRYLTENKEESGIIYAATRKEVDRLYTRLIKSGVNAGRYHAGMSEHERSEQQELFLQDNISVMVATSAFGMGIDKSNVRFVIHYQIPKNMESYYQEAGRAGRDGLDSECVLLYSPQDIRVQRFLLDQSNPSEDRLNQELTKLNLMKDYCFTEGCLQAFILRYFGEENPDDCGRCENCRDSRSSVDVTTEAQMVLSCIIRMGERFGKTLVAQVLSGSKNKKIEEFGFKTLSTYGIMGKKSAKDITDFIDFLTARQFIALSGGQFPILKLTNEGKQVLLGKQQVLRKEIVKVAALSVDDELFQELRQLRKEIAQTENVPPFVIFSDATLKDMASRYPKTDEQFLEVKGVGKQKQEKYGAPFLSAIADFLNDHPELAPIEGPNHPTPKEKGEPTHLESLHYFQQNKSVNEIAEIRGLSPVSVENHLIKCALEELELDWGRILSDEQQQLILKAAGEVGADKLKPLKEALPEDITYFMIKAALVRKTMLV